MSTDRHTETETGHADRDGGEWYRQRDTSIQMDTRQMHTGRHDEYSDTKTALRGTEMDRQKQTDR